LCHSIRYTTETGGGLLKIFKPGYKQEYKVFIGVFKATYIRMEFIQGN